MRSFVHQPKNHNRHWWTYLQNRLLADRGGLPHYRIGGAIRITQADLEAFLAGCRRERDGDDLPTPRPRLKLKHIKL